MLGGFREGGEGGEGREGGRTGRGTDGREGEAQEGPLDRGQGGEADRGSPPAASPLSVFPGWKICGATRRSNGSRRASERRPHRAISPVDLSAGDSGTGASGSLSPRRRAAVSHGLGAAAWLGVGLVGLRA